MNRRTWNALLIGGSTLAGGVAGSWLTSKATVSMGCNLGPWGVVAGAVLGALIGAALSSGPQPEEGSQLDTA
jgi:hypothetical protein